MARYFTFFPTTYYKLNDNSNALDGVTKITTRFTFEPNFKENSAAYLKYDVKDTDTPDIIARKLYDDSEYHWIVLNYNDIIDPQWDWNLEYRTFIEYVRSKYAANAANSGYQTGLEYALSENNVHSYYKVITRTHADSSEHVQKIQINEDAYINLIPTTITFTPIEANTTIVVTDLTSGNSSLIHLDEKTFANLDLFVSETITKEAKTFYEYETEENDKRRSIKLLKKDFVYDVYEEFKEKVE